MSGEQDWRIPVDTLDYLTNQQKKLGVADRRPVIRAASDLGLGPGFAAQAVPITDFNDILATFNGMYSAEIGTSNAPNADEDFVGLTIMDSEMGGVQRFTGLDTGTDYKRVFLRNPSDAESIFWGAWQTGSGDVPTGALMPFTGSVAPEGWLICDGTSYSTALYPALFTVTGTTFGGSGGTFAVPDLRDRSIYGVGTAWTLGGTDGIAAGSRTKNLYHIHDVLTANAGAHPHGIIQDGSHDHGGSTGSPSNTVNVNTGTSHSPASGVHTHSISSGGLHSHGSSTLSNGDHYHTGSTFDLLSTGPIERGVGMLWIVKHG